MSSLFDLSCRHCGSPLGYDIVRQSYRCPSCGREAPRSHLEQDLPFHHLDRSDQTQRISREALLCCPNCGAEVFYGASDESQTCAFCGSTLIRREFQDSDDFPAYLIPFVLTPEEARQALTKNAQNICNRADLELITKHLSHLEGYYLPYSLVQGPVSGTVQRENVSRLFHVRGFARDTLVNTSRQLDNEILDAAEPFDLRELTPFEYGYIAGQNVKLADLSGAKRHRRTLQEAGEDLRPELERIFHTDALHIQMQDGDLMEIPVLLPVYLLSIQKRLIVVNGQTGRVAISTEQQRKRSPLWMLEPLALCVLILLSLWPVTGSLFMALVSSIPLIASILVQYTRGHFSLFGSVILQSPQVRAYRKEQRLYTDVVRPAKRFPMTPVFQEIVDEKPADVSYRFYPPLRTVTVIGKTLAFYFFPTLVAAFLHFVLGMGNGFRLIGSIPWLWCFGVFCTVYIFSGIRGDAYEKPYIYRRDKNNSNILVGSAASRRLPFFACIGFDRQGLAKFEKKKIIGLFLGLALMWFISVYTTICIA